MRSASLKIEPQRHLLWIGLVFFSIAMLFIALYVKVGPFAQSVHVFGLGFELVSAGLGVWLIGIVVWWARQRGRFDPFEPPVWISLNAYVLVILNVWWLQRDQLPYVRWLQDNYQTMMPLAVILFGVGLSALWGGYVWGFRRLRRNAQQLQPRAGAMRVSNVVIIWFLGWIAGVIAVLTGVNSYLGTGSTTWANYFAFVDLVTNAAATALIIRHFRHSTLKSWFWFVLAVGSNIVLALIVGSKSFAQTLLLLAMYFYYANKRLPIRGLIIGLVIIVMFVPVVNNYRDALQNLDRGSGVGLSDRAEALATNLQEVITQPFDTLFLATTDTFSNRQGGMLNIAASAMFLHPNLQPFVGLEMVEYFFPQLIPRVLFPFKSTERPSLYMITTTYGGAPSEYSFTAIGQFADSYRAGGWATVIIWFGVLGIFTAWLYLEGPGSGNLAGTVFYITVLTLILRYDFDTATILIQLIQFGILLWLIVMRGMFVWMKKPQDVTVSA